MKMLRLLPALLLIFLITTPALASVVTGAKYTGTIRVSENGTAEATMVSANFTLNTTGFIENGFASENLTDMGILYGGSDVPFMPSYSSNTCFLFVDSIDQGLNIDYTLYSGNVTGGKYVWFPGATGLDITDSATLEPGDNYTIELDGYIDTTQVGDELIDRGASFEIAVSATNTISVAISTTEKLVATGVTPGEYRLTLSDNTTHMTLEIDDVVVSSNTSTAIPNAGDWDVAEDGGDVIRYMEYLEVAIDGNQCLYYTWQYGDTFTDQSSYGNDPHAVTFRTTGSHPNVTAELLNLNPVSQAQASTLNWGDVTGFLTDTPDAIAQLYTELDFTHIPGGDAINAVLDEAEVPRSLWWFPLIYISIALIGLLVYQATTLRVRNGAIGSDSSSVGSLMAMCIVIEVLLGIFGIMNPVPFWPALLFPIPAFAVIISQKHWSWG